MRPLKRREALAGVAAVGFAFATGAARRASAEPPTDKEIWTDVWGRTLAGYDCVSYFAAGGPVEGSRAYEINWRGATWLFASMTSMETFARAADRYAPLCGGYCVQTLASMNRLVGCDPLVWEMHEGRLVMLSGEAMRAAWRADPSGSVAAADAAYRARFDDMN